MTPLDEYPSEDEPETPDGRRWFRIVIVALALLGLLHIALRLMGIR